MRVARSRALHRALPAEKRVPAYRHPRKPPACGSPAFENRHAHYNQRGHRRCHAQKHVSRRPQTPLRNPQKRSPQKVFRQNHNRGRRAHKPSAHRNLQGQPQKHNRHHRKARRRRTAAYEVGSILYKTRRGEGHRKRFEQRRKGAENRRQKRADRKDRRGQRRQPRKQNLERAKQGGERREAPNKPHGRPHGRGVASSPTTSRLSPTSAAIR